MNILFKKGLFLHITSHDTLQWEKDIDNFKNFQHLDSIEIWIEETDLSDDEILWLKNRLSSYQLIIHAPFINLTLISIHKSINEASLGILKKSIDIGAGLNAKLITFHGGAHPLFLENEIVRKIFIENFKKLMDYAVGKIEITIENISMKKNTQISYPVLLDELSEIKKIIPDINFTLDVGHCTQNDDKFIEFLKKYQSSIKNIHFHNAKIGGQAHYGFNKEGDLDLKNFINILKEIKYSNFISLEVLGDEDITESWKFLLKLL